jgi:putative hemolysin
VIDKKLPLTLAIFSLFMLSFVPSALAIPDPSAVYCTERGYVYEVINTPTGQQGICKFPDGTQCDAWAFYDGPYTFTDKPNCGEQWRGFDYDDTPDHLVENPIVWIVVVGAIVIGYLAYTKKIKI